MALTPEQDQDLRGSIGDVERRLTKAQMSLREAVGALDDSDPDGLRYALDDATDHFEAATTEVETMKSALAQATEPPQS